MGAGIGGVIPITLGQQRWGERIEEKNFPKGFFDNYSYDKDTSLYTIKEELLLVNQLSDFFDELADLIYSSPEEKDREKFGDIPTIVSMEQFRDYFSKTNRNAARPYIEEKFYFSTTGGLCEEYLLFYIGSYKALLETYCILRHFENVLSKAMSNPLGKSIKMGMFG
jgi:hypothetical protein